MAFRRSGVRIPSAPPEKQASRTQLETPRVAGSLFAWVTKTPYLPPIFRREVVVGGWGGATVPIAWALLPFAGEVVHPPAGPQSPNARWESYRRNRL